MISSFRTSFRTSEFESRLPVSLTKQRAAERNGVAPWRTQKKAPFQKTKYQSIPPVQPVPLRGSTKSFESLCFQRVFQLKFRYITHITHIAHSDTSNSFPVFFPSMFFELLRESFQNLGYPLAGSSTGASPPISSSLTPSVHPFPLGHWVDFLVT